MSTTNSTPTGNVYCIHQSHRHLLLMKYHCILLLVFVLLLCPNSTLGQTRSLSHTVSISLESPPSTCTVTADGSFDFGTIVWPASGSSRHLVTASVVGTNITGTSISVGSVTNLSKSGVANTIRFGPTATCFRGQFPPNCLTCDPPCTGSRDSPDRITTSIYLYGSVGLTGPGPNFAPRRWPVRYPAGTYTGSVTVNGTCS